MKQHRSTRISWRMLATFLLASALCWTVGLRAASAAPIKVACIGEHTTHSDAFPANNRETQPVGMQEYPAQLQTMLGVGYNVHNFGDCCATVLQGYTAAETHPYVNGALAGRGPGYNESLTFLPDIVIIGSWGRHDWGMSKAAGQMFTVQGFQDGFDDLVKRYQALANHPKIFISLPIPILNGHGDVADNGVKTNDVLPAFKAIAAKYNLPIIDLYTVFLNHMEYYKQPADGEGEGEHANALGLTMIAKTVYAAMQADLLLDGGTADASAGGTDASTGSGGGTGAGGAALGSGGSGGSVGSGGTSMVGGTGGQGTSGDQAGSSAMPQAGGSNAAAGASAAAAASDSGCSCSFGSRQSSPARTATLVLGGLALLIRRRQRAKIRS